MGSPSNSPTYLSLQDQLALLEQQLNLLPETNRQQAQQALNDLRQAIAAQPKASPTGDQNGQPGGSPKKRANRDVLDAFLALAPQVLIYLEAPSGQVGYMSQSGYTLLRHRRAQHSHPLSLEEMLAEWRLYEPGNSTPLLAEAYPHTRTLRHGEAIENLQLVLVHQDGERIPIRVDSRPVYNALHKLTGVVLVWQNMSEVKQAQDALQLSEHRNSDILRTLAECYYHLDKNWRIVEINDAALEFFNRPRDFFLGKRVWDIQPMGVDSLFEDEYLRAVHEQHPVHFESPSRLVDRWAEVFAYPDETGLSVFFREISVRKLTEQSLREANQKLKLMLNSITEAFFVLDRSWRIMEYNRIAEQQIFRLPFEERVGRVFWEVYPNMIGSEFYKQYHRAFATGRPVHFEAYSEIAARWYEVHAYPRDQVIEIYLHDINLRKIAEERLQFQARLLENAQDAIIATDANNNVQLWNQAAEQMYGWSEEEAIGQSFFKVVPTDMDEVERERFLKSLRNRSTFRNVMVHKTRDGRSIFVEANGFVLRDQEGIITGFATSHRDISAHKRNEEDLRSSRQRVDDILSSITDNFFALDRQWHFTYVNSAIAQTSGRAAEDMMGKVIWEEFPYLLGTQFEEVYRRVMDGRLPERFETESPETGAWYNVSVHPSSEGISVYLINITDQMRTRQLLEQSQRRQREVLEGIRDEFFALDHDFRFVYANGAAAQQAGLSIAELTGQLIWDIFPELEKKPMGTLFRNVMQEREPVSVSHKGDRSGHWYEVRVYPSGDGISVYSVDKTEVRQVELERERLLEENQAQHELLERMVSSAPIGIVVLAGPDHQVVLVNSVILQMSNQLVEMSGQPAAEVWPEFVEHFRTAVEQVYQTGESIKVEDEPLSLDRGAGLEEAFFSISFTALRDDDGAIVSVLTLVTETTATVNARRELEKQQNLLSIMVDHMPVGVWVTDALGNIIYGNPAVQRIWGGVQYVGPDKFGLFKGWWAETGQPLLPEEWGAARAIKCGETSLNETVEIESFDGIRKTIINSVVPVKDAQGNILGAVVLNEDITERRRADEALRASEAKVSRLVDSNLIGILVGKHGQIVEANDAFLDMIGYTRAELIDGKMSWRNLTPKEFLERDERASQEALARGECTPYEKEFLRKDGHRVPVLIGYALLTETNHEYICFVINQTERKRTEHNARFLARLVERLFRTPDPEQRARVAARLLGRFLNGSHSAIMDVSIKSGELLVNADCENGWPSLVGAYHIPDILATIGSGLSKGRILSVPDVTQSEKFSPFMADLTRLGIRSGIFAPHISEGEWIGALVIASDRQRAWRADEVALVQSAADLTWLAIRNSRLIQRLRETRERFNVALKNSPVMVYTCDRNLRINWVYNPAFGMHPDEMVGKTTEDLVDPVSASSIRELKQAVLDNGIGQRKEITVRRNEKEGIFDITVEPLRDENSQILGLTVSAVELTEQRRLELEMQDQAMHAEIQRRIMEQRERERVEIARDLHDGPLQEMIAINFGLTEALQFNEKDERLKKINFLQDAIQRQIRDLREFCSELRPPALAPFGLEKAILSHADTFRFKYPNITLRLDLMKDAQTLGESLRLSLYRIYQELIHNVVRHSGATEVTVRLWLDANEVTLLVEDNGHGFAMPPEWVDLARQGHMGLVGVRERAESVQGTVQVFSSDDGGTTVVVTVPRGS